MSALIRKAEKSDIQRIIELLHQVNMVHHVIRPDLFKPHTTKYDEQELESMLSDDSKPIFVYDDGEVRGYAFCQITEVRNHKLLEDVKTLYIDDICVDEEARGHHVGKSLYEYVRDYAQSIGYPESFTIYDAGDSVSLIKTCLKELGLDEKTYKPKEVLSRISLAKNNLITSNAYAANKSVTETDRRGGRPELYKVFQLYERKCRQAGVMDFDDILVNMYFLLRGNPEACEAISACM